MNVCLARQPIFDVKLNVIGYEILYRSSETSTSYDCSDPDLASSQMIMMGLDAGIKKLTEDRLAFVNFTEKLLLSGVTTILPKSHLVVEILEDVLPESDVMKACRNLKKLGYILSLDDYVYSEKSKAFLEVADIIKIDFLNRSVPDIEKDVRLITSSCKAKLLAEKVETREVFDLARGMGFEYFQGYFFSRPEIFGKKKLTPLRVNQLQLIRHAMDPLVDYRKLAAIIKNDAVLSYRILRLVNSAYYGLQYTIKNIRHALAILGIDNIKKYVTLLTLEQMTDEKPEELVRISLIRGRFLESLAPLVGMRKAKEDLFLMGLLSLIDVLSDTPMNEVIEKTSLPEKVALPLLSGTGVYADLLNIIINYERGNWDAATEIADNFGLSSQEIFKIFIDSVEWASELLHR